MTPYRWRRLRQITQWFFVLLFLYLFFGALPDSEALLPVDLFFRANPLAALSASLARLEILTHFALALVAVVLTLVFGRVWCGWVCPLGTVLELFTFRRAVGRWLPERWRLREIKYLLLLTLILLALLIYMRLVGRADAGRPGWRTAILWVVWGGVFLLALLAKEIALLIPFFALAYEVIARATGRLRLRRSGRATASRRRARRRSRSESRTRRKSAASPGPRGIRTTSVSRSR